MHDIMQVHGVFIPPQTTRGASWHFWAYFGVRKLLVERKCDFFSPDVKRRIGIFLWKRCILVHAFDRPPGPVTGTYGRTAGLIRLTT